jgi:hypothetical protein
LGKKASIFELKAPSSVDRRGITGGQKRDNSKEGRRGTGKKIIYPISQAHARGT